MTYFDGITNKFENPDPRFQSYFEWSEGDPEAAARGEAERDKSKVYFSAYALRHHTEFHCSSPGKLMEMVKRYGDQTGDKMKIEVWYFDQVEGWTALPKLAGAL